MQGHVLLGFRCVAVSACVMGALLDPLCNNSRCCDWLQGALDVTGTFKYLKVKLVEEGFNPNQVTDPLYFLDEKDKNYVPLTLDIFKSVVSGKIKI